VHGSLAGGDELGVGNGAVAIACPRGRGAQLLDYARGPRREHDDPVGEVERLLDVVGDEDDRARVGVEGCRQPSLHLGAGDRVERGEGLVEDEHRLAGDERAQEGDPLAHPARELGRPGALEAGQAEALEEAARLDPRLAAADATVAQRQRRVVDRAQPGEQHVALRQEGAAGEAVGRIFGPAHPDRPAAGLLQTRDQLEQGRLAAARGPDHAEDAVLGHLEVEPLDRLEVAVGVAHASDRDPGERRIVAGRRWSGNGELLSFRAHVGILAQSALLTKEVRKVDK